MRCVSPNVWRSGVSLRVPPAAAAAAAGAARASFSAFPSGHIFRVPLGDALVSSQRACCTRVLGVCRLGFVFCALSCLRAAAASWRARGVRARRSRRARQLRWFGRPAPQRFWPCLRRVFVAPGLRMREHNCAPAAAARAALRGPCTPGWGAGGRGRVTRVTCAPHRRGACPRRSEESPPPTFRGRVFVGPRSKPFSTYLRSYYGPSTNLGPSVLNALRAPRGTCLAQASG